MKVHTEILFGKDNEITFKPLDIPDALVASITVKFAEPLPLAPFPKLDAVCAYLECNGNQLMRQFHGKYVTSQPAEFLFFWKDEHQKMKHTVYQFTGFIANT